MNQYTVLQFYPRKTDRALIQDNSKDSYNPEEAWSKKNLKSSQQ